MPRPKVRAVKVRAVKLGKTTRKEHATLCLELDGEQIEVDQEIVPLVIALNELPGIRTLASCQEEPYVMFRGLFGATEDVTRQLAEWLVSQGQCSVGVSVRWLTGKLPTGHLQVYYRPGERLAELRKVTEAVRELKYRLDARRPPIPLRQGSDPQSA